MTSLTSLPLQCQEVVLQIVRLTIEAILQAVQAHSEAPSGEDWWSCQLPEGEQREPLSVAARRMADAICFAQLQVAKCSTAFGQRAQEALQGARRAGHPELKAIKDAALKVRGECILLASHSSVGPLVETAECAADLLRCTMQPQ